MVRCCREARLDWGQVNVGPGAGSVAESEAGADIHHTDNQGDTAL